MTQTQTYSSLKSAVDILHKDRSSKFYGYAFPVQSVDAIKAHLVELKNLYPDASHICYAYLLGVDGTTFRANDDGEPSNTAGQPILREIKSLGLTNVFVAVVRYFGGKKLGVPGLIEAYGTAARLALDAGEVVTKTIQKTCWLKHLGAKDYQIYEIANRYGFKILKPPTIPGGYFQIEMPLESFSSLLTALQSLPNFELTDKPNGF
ncbi:MAG: putative IMPACT (imprinted ancient) family translation regulator [Bacteroidia bacterium]|jgi:putative IMPACT (imprinted ancient) family translation regulator